MLTISSKASAGVQQFAPNGKTVYHGHDGNGAILLSVNDDTAQRIDADLSAQGFAKVEEV